MGTHSKHETFYSSQVQNIYPKDKNKKRTSYNKHLISAYQQAQGNSYIAILNMIKEKSYITNLKLLERMGYKVVTGSVHKVTEASLVEYLIRKKYKNIIIQRNIRVEYLLEIEPYFWCKCTMWSPSKSAWARCVCADDFLVPEYKWNGKDTRIYNTGIKYSRVNDKSLEIIKRLEDDPNVILTTDNYTYTCHEFNIFYQNNAVSDTIKYTYHQYKISGTKYKLVFTGSRIDYKIKDNVIKVHFKDSGGNDNWYELPSTEETYVVFAFKADNSRQEQFIVEKLSKILEINVETNTFLWTSIKHGGSMQVNKHNSQNVLLKKFGIRLPKDIAENTNIKEAAASVSSTYNNEDPNIDKIIKSLYGTADQPNRVKIYTPNGELDYNLLVYQYGITRDDPNGYVTAPIVFHDQDVKKSQPGYLIPIGSLNKAKLPDFYNGYYNNLTVWTYMEDIVKLKWYQTEFFTFIMFAITVASCHAGPTTCAIMFATMIALQTILNPILKRLGFSNDQIQIIDLIIEIVVIHEVPISSAATVQSSSALAESTASSTSTVAIQTATNTSMEATQTLTNEIGQAGMNAATSAAETFGTTTTESVLQQTEDWITTKASSMVTAIEKASWQTDAQFGMQVTQIVANSQYKKNLNKDKAKLSSLQDTLTKNQNKIKREFEEQFKFEPFDMLDSYDDMRWMDLFDMQDMIDNTEPIDDTITF